MENEAPKTTVASIMYVFKPRYTFSHLRGNLFKTVIGMLNFLRVRIVFYGGNQQA